VFYDCDNEDFEKYVEKFGFVTAYGSFTDICHLCPSWGVAGVNLSVGYRDEHTVSEVLFVGQLLDTIEKVKKMLSEREIPEFVYIPSPLYYYSTWGNYKYDYYDDDDEFADYHFYTVNKLDKTNPKKTLSNVPYRCTNCQKTFFEDEVLPVKLIKGGTGYYCENCLTPKNIEWCVLCGEPFEIDSKNPNSIVCRDCKKGLDNEH
jgi:DNA-directed RNA polymerase subunit RPC12/RpoP